MDSEGTEGEKAIPRYLFMRCFPVEEIQVGY
jgi:hypothetical protein